MAKKKSGGVNKSQAIRDYLTDNPGATASTIKPALAEKGIDVSVALIGQIKQRMKKSGGAAKKKAGRKKAAGRKSSSGSALSARDLVEAKKLVDDLGGIHQAREALKYLEELG